MRTANKLRVLVGVLLLVVLAVVGIICLAIFHGRHWSVKVVRLPASLSPVDYTVVLQSHFYTRLTDDTNATVRDQNRLMTGNSTVTFLCLEKTSSIVLHAAGLNISDPVVTDLHSNRTLEVYDVWEKPGQILEIRLKRHLEVGHRYSLFLDFRRETWELTGGIYIAGYNGVEKDDVEEVEEEPDRFLVATNMEPTDARKVFPCFDEPQMKAVFHVTVVHRRNTTALGNTAVRESRVIDDDWMLTRFHPTPKMSTYLFAVVVSEFTALTSAHPRVHVQIYSQPSDAKSGRSQFAANVTGRILDFYEKYLGIEYKLSKLDQIALPHLLAAAMENWGLVTYQDFSLLQFRTAEEQDFLQSSDIVRIIAHELAHQWFGNLVTMKWWNELWLKEGFATYMTRPAMNQVIDDLPFLDLMDMRVLQECLAMDAAQSRPLTVPLDYIQERNDLLSLYDAISYNKGAAVLNMLADALDQQVFLAGVKMYLKDFSYSSADQFDLWSSVQKAVNDHGGHVDVAEVMTTWTTQAGFPLLTINTKTGEVSQEHWSHSAKDSSRRWHVPVRVMTGSSGPSVVFLPNHRKVQREELRSRTGEWILANVNCTGYYKVNYDPENWQRLVAQLETDLHRIPVLNRLGLIQGVFEFSEAQILDLELSLNLTRYLQHETAYLPWLMVAEKLQEWTSMLDGCDFYGLMQAYWATRVRRIYEMFRSHTYSMTPPRAYSQQHLQKIAVYIACSNGLPECVEMSSRTLASWLSKNQTKKTESQNPESLEFLVLCSGMAADVPSEWDQVWDLVQSFNRTELYPLLCCTTNTSLLQRLLEATLDTGKISAADRQTIVSNISRYKAGHQLAWDFIQAHWGDFQNEWTGWFVLFTLFVAGPLVPCPAAAGLWFTMFPWEPPSGSLVLLITLIDWIPL